MSAIMLVPFISGHTFQIVRAVALVVAAVIIQTLVVEVALEFEIILSVLFGTILISVVTGLIAPIKITPRFLVCAAGAAYDPFEKVQQ
jgi:hypothetical protein